MACVGGSAAVPARSIARSRLSIQSVVSTMGPGAADLCVHVSGPSGWMGPADELVGVIRHPRPGQWRERAGLSHPPPAGGRWATRSLNPPDSENPQGLLLAVTRPDVHPTRGAGFAVGGCHLVVDR